MADPLTPEVRWIVGRWALANGCLDDPPQDDRHIGIVTEDDGSDGTVVRHCPTSENRC
jgi:hypothetical protein